MTTWRKIWLGFPGNRPPRTGCGGRPAHVETYDHFASDIGQVVDLELKEMLLNVSSFDG